MRGQNAHGAIATRFRGMEMGKMAKNGNVPWTDHDHDHDLLGAYRSVGRALWSTCVRVIACSSGWVAAVAEVAEVEARM